MFSGLFLLCVCLYLPPLSLRSPFVCLLYLCVVSVSWFLVLLCIGSFVCWLLSAVSVSMVFPCVLCMVHCLSLGLGFLCMVSSLVLCCACVSAVCVLSVGCFVFSVPLCVLFVYCLVYVFVLGGLVCIVGVAQVVFAFWVCVFGVCFGVAGCGGVFWVVAYRSF